MYGKQKTSGWFDGERFPVVARVYTRMYAPEDKNVGLRWLESQRRKGRPFFAARRKEKSMSVRKTIITPELLIVAGLVAAIVTGGGAAIYYAIAASRIVYGY